MNVVGTGKIVGRVILHLYFSGLYFCTFQNAGYQLKEQFISL